MHVCRYEGPGCNIDVNECVRGTSGCAAHAGCTNTDGSFVCACDYGYSGKRSSAVLVTCSCSPSCAWSTEQAPS